MVYDLFEAPVISSDAKKTYLLRRKEELEKCQSALQAGQWETISRVGHKLKGSAETFGFPELSDLGSSLEERADRKAGDEIKRLLSQLGKVVDDSLAKFLSPTEP